MTLDATTAIQRADGSWEFDGVATRGDAVFDYSGEAGEPYREYRPMGEVFAPNSIESLAGATITDDHPANFVDIYNARELSRGTVLRAWQDGTLMRVRVVIRDAELLQKIRDGKVELSCGYSAVLIPGDGVHPTEGAYQGTQTQIIHNHLAVVDAARAGPVARLAVPPMPAPAAPGTDRRPDSAGPNRRDSMEIIINGVTYTVDPNATTVPQAVSEAWQALQTQLQQQAAQIVELQKAAGAAPGAADPAAAAAAAAGAPAPAAGGDGKPEDKTGQDGKAKPLTQADVSAQVKQELDAARKLDAARIKVVTIAARALPANYVFDGKSTDQIAVDAIVALDKDYKATAEQMLRDRKSDALAAVLDVKVAAAGRHHVDGLADLLARSNAGRAEGRQTADQVRDDRVRKLQHRNKPAAAQPQGNK